ncbi:MAG TPA: plastocyanin/azurin family copper-binding protein [Solirubrobacteraceae bacterium]|nr:plastocyanin/azurin family copper-binding protein [Solirubrobacteraceae bacterium]
MCGAFVAIAIAVPGHTSRHRRSHTTRVCRRGRHRHCQLTRARKKSHHKHKPQTTSKPANPGPGSDAPWSTVPPSAIPGPSPSNSGQPSGAPVDKDPPAKSPADPTPEATPRVEVTAEDTEAFRFVLSRSTVPAGKVILEFVNHGQDEHNLNAVEETEDSVAGSLPNTPSNGHLSLTVDLRPGNYTLFCSLPGHEAKGMKATLLVE